MSVIDQGRDLIKSYESCRLKAYKCPAGVWTIGYGHTGSEIHEGLAITQGEADALFTADLCVFDAGVAKTCPISSANQHAAMTSLAYNIGLKAFAGSSVARLHNQGKCAEAGQAFALWNMAGGKVRAGLVSRRAAEAALYLRENTEHFPNGEGEKPLAASRTLNGQALAGVGTIASVGLSEVDRPASLLQDWQEALSSLIPYFESVKWVVVALVLGGIGLSVFARWHDRREGRC
jgi:lysozyme